MRIIFGVISLIIITALIYALFKIYAYLLRQHLSLIITIILGVILTAFDGVLIGTFVVNFF